VSDDTPVRARRPATQISARLRLQPQEWHNTVLVEVEDRVKHPNYAKSSAAP